MRRLLPRMQLAGYASSILHPLIRVIDSPSEDLRRDALDTVCSLALALGPDLAIFSTTIQKVIEFHMPLFRAPCSRSPLFLLRGPLNMVQINTIIAPQAFLFCVPASSNSKVSAQLCMHHGLLNFGWDVFIEPCRPCI